MKKYFDKKFTIVVSLMLIVLFLCIIAFFLVRNRLVFVLRGDEVYELEVGKEFKDPGVVAKKQNEDFSSQVQVDASGLDNETLGKYKVTYTLEYNGEKKEIIRYVEVVDKTKPAISLNGDKEIVILKGEEYEDLGSFVSDNYDEDIKKKIVIYDYVNTEVPGVYEVMFEATDQSGNVGKLNRRVIVKEDLKQSMQDVMESNNVTFMEYTNDGIYLKGYQKENNGKFIINICSDKDNYCFDYEMNKVDKYYYEGNINLTLLQNGEYTLYIETGDSKELLFSNMIDYYKLGRTKLKDKLITFSYANDKIKIKVEDHKYQYDVVIDPGHGGEDPGALNNVTDENHFNLTQSLYEKQRLEEHGLEVLLLRDTTENYGIVMGSEDWPNARRKGYAIGYYGAVSKLVYSNHHNSSEDISLTGWEIIVPVQASKESVQIAYDVASLWEDSYPVLEEHERIYTRNYTNGAYLNKSEGENYDFRNYYGVIRIPHELFNVNNIIFEGCYLSNHDDFTWYYTEENYIKMTEEKIKAIVESLGVKYIAP